MARSIAVNGDLTKEIFTLMRNYEAKRRLKHAHNMRPRRGGANVLGITPKTVHEWMSRSAQPGSSGF